MELIVVDEKSNIINSKGKNGTKHQPKGKNGNDNYKNGAITPAIELFSMKI